MVLYDRELKQIIIPSGLGEGYVTGGGCPECPECPQDWDEAIAIGFQGGYTSGRTDGMEEQAVIDHNRLTHFSATTNGTYTAPYGYSEIDVHVTASGDCSEAIAEAYASGLTGGAAQQKALLTSTAITSNGTYTREDGWNSVTVDVPSGDCSEAIAAAYQSGISQGYNLCVSNMRPLTATTNGTYNPNPRPGYSEVIVNVPPTMLSAGTIELGYFSINTSGTFVTTQDMTIPVDQYKYVLIPHKTEEYMEIDGNNLNSDLYPNGYFLAAGEHTFFVFNCFETSERDSAGIRVDALYLQGNDYIIGATSTGVVPCSITSQHFILDFRQKQN